MRRKAKRIQLLPLTQTNKQTWFMNTLSMEKWLKSSSLLNIGRIKNWQKARSYQNLKLRAPPFLTLLDPSKTEWVTALSWRLVHTLCLAQCLAAYLFRDVLALCSAQVFGSTQVLSKLANVSIASEDPHRSKCLVSCFNSGPSQLSDKTSLFSCLHCSVQLTGARVAPGWPQNCQPITGELWLFCFALIGPINGWKEEEEEEEEEGELPYVDHVPSFRQGPW